MTDIKGILFKNSLKVFFFDLRLKISHYQDIGLESMFY